VIAAQGSPNNLEGILKRASRAFSIENSIEIVHNVNVLGGILEMDFGLLRF
jgi:hypothetical protein